jgi:protein dithiol oxidoreductase (disulfide-forming)
MLKAGMRSVGRACLRTALLCALSAASSLTLAATPVEAQDYQRLPVPLTQASSAGVEVIEFFSYGCRACFEMHRRLGPWLAEIPRATRFTRVPITFGRARWHSLARTYYALQKTGDLQRLDGALFEAIHAESQSLFDEASVLAWVTRQAVDPAAFLVAYRSDEVSAQIRRGEEMARSSAIQLIPTLVVDGRYVVRGPTVRTYEDMLRVAADLVRQAAGQSEETRQD